MNEDILRDLNHRIDDVLEYGREVIEDDEIMDRVERLREQSEHFIRENPLKSMAAGLIGGYFIGKLFSSDD